MSSLKIIVGLFVMVGIMTPMSGQYKAIEFEISNSAFLDDYRDTEYSYDYESNYGGIAQFSVGYSFLIHKKLTLSPRVAYARSLHTLGKRQIRTIGGSLEDRTFIEKRKKISFIKTGVALSYWFSKPASGFYFESEVQNLFLLDANSDEMKREGEGDIMNYSVSFREDVKGFVPSARVGVGYSLLINRVSLFIRFSREIRFTTYFKSTDNYTWLNRSVGLGFRYVFPTTTTPSS
ncbi:MAG: hypothetical protein P1U56_12625 [Saprospiraceae bacterium]|nr:hypothetical protein [Saprospiraceae bacterium]